jgi:hypothetical protein
MVHFTDSGDVGRISKPERAFFRRKSARLRKMRMRTNRCEDVFQEWPQFPGMLYHFPIFFMMFPYFPLFSHIFQGSFVLNGPILIKAVPGERGISEGTSWMEHEAGARTNMMIIGVEVAEVAHFEAIQTDNPLEFELYPLAI